MPLSQKNRAVKVHTVLGDDKLLFSSLNGTERLGELFHYRLELISDQSAIALEDLLGTDITIEIELPLSDFVPANSYRYINGIVSDCAQIGSTDSYTHYEFSLRPWFWFLTRTADCRIFQDKSVPEIVKETLSDSGFAGEVVDERINPGDYEKWRYCVQYRETDFNFISRLLEQEGIYYFFEHDQGMHKLVLVDGYSNHDKYPHYDSIPYYPVDDAHRRERDHLTGWQLHKHLQPGKFVSRDFNFETPKAKLEASSSITASHARSDYEIFDYPAEYPGSDGVPDPKNSDTTVRHRMEELAVQHDVASGTGNCQALLTGYLFTLTNCEREDQNKEYLIVESSCTISQDAYNSGSDVAYDFHGSIEAIDSNLQYRSPRKTPKPVVQGPQTAMVVGDNGKDFWTDEYGRVKLQFHWDRYGKSDEDSSCWVRVSQAWAGQGWGSFHVPRIGQEVIVEFLEGDPDRPIVTGRVYNGDNGYPYELPKNQTVSGIKSRSSDGNANSGSTTDFNEFRMEDKKDKEEIYIHAERDMNIVVENDKTLTVGFDKSESGDYTVDVKNDRTTTIDSGNDFLQVKKGNRDVVVDTGNYSMEVGQGNHTTTVSTGNKDTEISMGNQTTNVALGSSTLEAMQSITLKVGGNSVVIDQQGITIKGLMVKVDAQMTADVKAGLSASVQGLKTSIKGDAMTEVNGSAMVKIQGGVTMIN